MYEIYTRWPELARNSFEIANQKIAFDGINHIVFAGMGGSGTLGDIFSAIFSQTNSHVSVVKGYHLPNNVDTETLVVATSVSGNTAETISVVDEAKKKNCKIISFSCGGKLAKYCKNNNIIYHHVEKVHSPRASLANFLYYVLNTLVDFIPLNSGEILNSIHSLEKISKEISTNNLSSTNPALDLAKHIKKIPIIYYPWGLQAAAIRFKNSLAENSKLPSITEDIIEACHNNIVSWESQNNLQPILVRGIDDYHHTKKRWDIIKEYFRMHEIDFYELVSVNGNILTKLITLIYLLDYSSIYYAVLSGIDPTPVQSIDFVKTKLNVSVGHKNF